MLPKWLSLPVEQHALTQQEAELILHLDRLRPPVLLDDERDAVMKLEWWSKLALMETENQTPH